MKNASDMNFEHLFNLFTELKRESLSLIQQAKMMEKVAQKKHNSTS